MPLEIIRQPRENQLVTMGQPNQIVTSTSAGLGEDDWYLPPGATEPVRRKKPPIPPSSPAVEPEPESTPVIEPEPMSEGEPQPESGETQTVEIEASKAETSAPRRGRPRKAVNGA